MTKKYDYIRLGKNCFKRFRDRGWLMTIKTKKCDVPNTRHVRQKDLNAQYTGVQIKIGKKFAQMF
jgi:hypothetical protein